MTPPRFFVDTLTIESSWVVRRWQRELGATGQVTVLDPLPVGVRGWVARTWARCLGLDVAVADFFLGHLRDDAGENLFRSARRQSALVAWSAAKTLMAASPLLRSVNHTWGRETVRLSTVKRLWPSAERVIRLMWVARALTRAGEHDVCIVVQDPAHFDLETVQREVPRTSVRRWGAGGARAHALASAFQGWWRLWVSARGRTATGNATAPVAGTGILLLQEDELGTARDERFQPHWTDRDAPVRVVVWASAGTGATAVTTAAASALAAHGVTVLDEHAVQAATKAARSMPLVREFAAAAADCFRAALAAPTPVSLALSGAGKLLVRGGVAAALCDQYKISTFVSGESYLLDAGAVHLAAPRLGVTTVSYQYSNISFLSPAMMNTADLMLLFAPMYRVHWDHDGVAPQVFGVLGYPYDTNIGVVRPRAIALRKTLEAAGATCVVGYFDESVQTGRWGVVHADEHAHDIQVLARAVVDDPTLAVIVKTQFARNSPSRSGREGDVLRAARETGRFVELCRGAHRNVVFPSEAALASDITLGHAIGGTAVVESAVAGCRSLILNPYEWWTSWDKWYANAGLVYPSLESAMAAIGKWRDGQDEFQMLGRWDPIIDEMVSMRDGQAASRLRTLVTLLSKGVPVDVACAEAGCPTVLERAS